MRNVESTWIVSTATHWWLCEIQTKFRRYGDLYDTRIATSCFVFLLRSTKPASACNCTRTLCGTINNSLQLIIANCMCFAVRKQGCSWWGMCFLAIKHEESPLPKVLHAYHLYPKANISPTWEGQDCFLHILFSSSFAVIQLFQTIKLM
jgi:hypothetical protein